MRRRSFDIGKMRHRVSVYATNREMDSSGGFDRTDPSSADLIGKYWCHIEPVSARERQWGEQYTEVVTHRCWLRYNSLLQEGMALRRIIRGLAVDYYLESLVDPDNLQQWHMLMLREGGPL